MNEEYPSVAHYYTLLYLSIDLIHLIVLIFVVSRLKPAFALLTSASELDILTTVKT